MLCLWWLGCTSPSSMNIEKKFSPTIIGAMKRLEWRYQDNCMGIYAHWYTQLPKGTSVQLVAGPKIEGNHFDEDALQDVTTSIDGDGKATLSVPSNTRFPAMSSFINMRVWAKNTSLKNLIVQSQQQGGFPLAQGPHGAYAWVESHVPACTQ